MAMIDAWKYSVSSANNFRRQVLLVVVSSQNPTSHILPAKSKENQHTREIKGKSKENFDLGRNNFQNAVTFFLEGHFRVCKFMSEINVSTYLQQFFINFG